jgi:thiol-disulfide isomerase/thioredoxin
MGSNLRATGHRPSVHRSLALALAALAWAPAPSPAGTWRGVLELAGGQLRFGLEVERAGPAWQGRLCNGSVCQPFSGVRVNGDSMILEITDYAATIGATLSGDSLAGSYRNVGNRGPRTIPFHASRGVWPIQPGSPTLLGRWDATFFQELGTSPRVLELRNGVAGLEGTIISNTGDYGHFAGRVEGDSFALSHFDGSFVYLITGALDGDTLRGTFHAGLRTQTPFVAVRSTGAPHLKAPTEVTGADTTVPFHFSAPDLSGKVITQDDPRFRGKVVLIDIFGSWCPTCHESAPMLVRLYRKYRASGLEIVGLGYEVTGNPAIDREQVRRYRDKFGIPFPLLLAGINDVEAAGATLPQLRGFTSFPTTVFLGRDGKVRQVHAGFYGRATGAQHERLVEGFELEIEKLLAEK